MEIKDLNIPLILTGVRLLSPLVLPLLIFVLWPIHNDIIHVFLMIVFLLLGLTDLLDGYLARKFKQVTKLGQLLDPIADKFLIVSTLIALQAVEAIGFIWVIILVLRELFVMGLRYVAREHHVAIPVIEFGKIKTWSQIVLIAYILSPYGYLYSWAHLIIYYLLLFFTIACSLYSAYCYYRVCIAGVFGKNEF
ncbi:TPA: CDP-diacylglycerol--glycerol-3-phosphate 3-phosphatidyltransferase [Candidatus Dependentiae bacterium]|nr:MAG: CDP-diacylglycerol-glycerol-3-phosphate 3-phosphatidyltransferase [candidate division TM6 bacterium GW2011_GWF2_36_131]KKQ03345.1 MAG: CDP-diacylglycerol-glycerol-3-phosphate 3-phosphatidyltransferase [candidate division TM6 bacterium GW2011_GWE2_36_25]KKQ19741.1 MAG: CDP-diacylglycerol-glycerol-3-phosphate 3-phosphatidyltransferase [candidate division TM6 bacterium GW2011_GWA2_36_9]HBR70877.1 CDP-diacylglycerol--glycerol-3-phosphate 3-phosphatidyltransferase [Candidatus Dependentiae bac